MSRRAQLELFLVALFGFVGLVHGLGRWFPAVPALVWGLVVVAGVAGLVRLAERGQR